MTKKTFLGAVIVIVGGALAGGFFGGGALATSEEIDESIKTLSHVLSVVEDRYFEEVPNKELVYNAIRGMLRTLDPHTNFLDRSSYSGMQEEQRGAFYGLGIVINKRGKNKPLTVISPIDGTPAARLGIRAGDVISHVVDEEAGIDLDTLGLDIHEAVKHLRGPKGSEVTIRVDRAGFDEQLEFTIVRDKVPTHSVTNAYLIRPETGYIKLVNFTQTSQQELEDSIETLRSAGMKRLVLDLRRNPGGLLDQAVKVADLFLGDGKMIVYTRGRVTGSDQEFHASDAPEGERYPIVVLVDDGSASASEIVAGALQDHDRALIVGKKTFGKGLVQSVFKLSRKTGLALTTAKYYTPSGRLIQRDYSSLEDYYFRLDEDEEGPTGEPALTDNGREVFGGGGIAPDIDVDREEASRLVVHLSRQNAFFDFAVRYASSSPATPADGDREERVAAFRAAYAEDEGVMAAFREYLAERKIPYEESELLEVTGQVLHLVEAEVAGILGGLAYRDRVLIESDRQVLTALESFDRARALAEARRPVSPVGIH